MAKSILDIVIRMVKEGGAEKDTVRGLTDIKKTAVEAAATFAAFAAAGYVVEKALNATVGAFVDYAHQVDDLSRLTGTSMEDSSRMIQMADDLAISYEGLQKSLWFASKNGVEVNIESMAKLADKYNGFNSATEKATFLAENFGKSGEEMGKLLELGGDGLRKLSDEQQKSLILTQESRKKALEYSYAVDALSDSWKGLTITIGQAVVPALTEAMNRQIDYARMNEVLNEQGASHIWVPYAQAQAAYEQARAEREAVTALKEKTRAQQDDTLTVQEAAAAAKVLTDSLKEHLGLIGNLQSAETSYEDNAKKLTSERVKLEQDRATKIAQGYSAAGSVIQGLDQDLANNASASAANAAQHDLDTKKILLGYLEQQLAANGLTTAEVGFLLQKGQAWGIYSSDVVSQALTMEAEVARWTQALNNIPGHIHTVLELEELGWNIVGHPGNPARYAGGGSFIVPAAYGSEGFALGGMATASAGELVTVTPRGGSGAGGSGGFTLVFNYQPGFSMGSRQEAETVIAPAVAGVIRRMQVDGRI